jgi:hypothetical protein
MKFNKTIVPLLLTLTLIGCGKEADSAGPNDLGLHTAAYATEPLGVTPNPDGSGDDVVTPASTDASSVANAKAQLKALLPQIKTACKAAIDELKAKGIQPPALEGKKKHKAGVLAKWLLGLGDQVAEPCRSLLNQAKEIRSTFAKSKQAN